MRNIGGFQKWLGDDVDIETVTPSMLKSYFIFMQQKHNKGGVHAAYRSLKALFNFYEFEYEPEKWRNPFVRVKLPLVKRTPLPEIPITNIQRLLDETGKGYNQSRDKAILFTLVDTGVRASELTALNIEDVNLETGSINILHGKGDKFRIVFLGDKGRKTVKEYLKKRPNANPDEPLFLTDEKKRFTYSGIREIIRRLSARANVPFQGVHSFRRCNALTIYRKTHDIFLVSRLLGHSDVETTRVYLNINNEDLREPHEKNSPGDLLD